MTEQSQMPLVGPPKRRGWAEIFWFRPLTASTHATLVVTRRGRLASILPAGGPRVLSDYLAWPYDFREVDTRERLLMIDQRVESFDSSYEFLVSLRLIYQVVRPDRVALELEDVSTELNLAVVQSLRLSGRSFGVEQDKTFEEHLQETLLSSDALAQRVQLLGLALRRFDVIVALDEPTRAHAESLRFAMRERPLHLQIAVESLEPDRRFDVHVGGAYRSTDRRPHDEPGDAIDRAIQTAIAHTLQRVGITFEPGDYLNAAKAMAEVLRKDALLQSELAMVHVQLLRPTVQIQPDRSMVHVPRPSMLGAPDLRSDPMLRRARQGLPRVGRPPALTDSQELTPQSPAPALRRALPSPQAPDRAASPTLPLEDLPAQAEPIEGAYALWPAPEARPAMRAQPTPSQSDDEPDQRAPWADLIRDTADHDDVPWQPAPSASLSEPAEPLTWGSLAAEAEQTAPWDGLAAEADRMALWDNPDAEEADSPVPWGNLRPAETESSLPWGDPVSEETDSPAPWGNLRAAQETEPTALWAGLAPEEPQQPLSWEQSSSWQADQSALPSAPLEPLPWELSAIDHAAEQQEIESALAFEPVEHQPSVQFDSEQTIQAPDAPLVSEPAAPEFVGGYLADDLGFSLDWSEPEAAQAPKPAADVSPHIGDATAHDPSFSIDWSDPQIDSPAQPLIPNADTIADTNIFMADWGNQDLAASQPTLFEPIPADDSVAGPAVPFDRWPSVDLDPASADSQQAEPESLPAAAEQKPQQDEALVAAEQEASPWYAPTLHFNDQLPFDSYPEAPLEVFGAAWADAPAPSEPSIDVAAEVPAEFLLEAFKTTWDDVPAPNEPSGDVAAEVPAETFGAAWVNAPAPSEPSAYVADAPAEASQESFGSSWDDAPAPSEPSDNIVAEAPLERSATAWDDAPTASIDAMAGDAGVQASDADPSAEPLLEAASARAGASEQIASDTEPASDISPDLIARMLGMIQSYGPAWFKMWSLELKERPERLPVVLGEVTADSELLAQANDPAVQAALLIAVEAYTSPPVHPSRLSAAASLPSPVVASQASSDQDEVPDWLSLRVKWNGHGGGS